MSCAMQSSCVLKMMAFWFHSKDTSSKMGGNNWKLFVRKSTFIFLTPPITFWKKKSILNDSFIRRITWKYTQCQVISVNLIWFRSIRSREKKNFNFFNAITLYFKIVGLKNIHVSFTSTLLHLSIFGTNERDMKFFYYYNISTMSFINKRKNKYKHLLLFDQFQLNDFIFRSVNWFIFFFKKWLLWIRKTELNLTSKLFHDINSINIFFVAVLNEWKKRVHFEKRK